MNTETRNNIALLAAAVAVYKLVLVFLLYWMRYRCIQGIVEGNAYFVRISIVSFSVFLAMKLVVRFQSYIVWLILLVFSFVLIAGIKLDMVVGSDDSSINEISTSRGAQEPSK